MNRRNSIFALIGGFFGFLTPKAMAVPLPIRKPAGWLIQWDQRASAQVGYDNENEYMPVHLFVFNETNESLVWWVEEESYTLPAEQWVKEYMKFVSSGQTKNVTCKTLYE